MIFCRYIFALRLRLGYVVVSLLLIPGGPSDAQDPVQVCRENLYKGLKNLAAVAQRHYHLPARLGGGNGSFTHSQGGQGIVVVSLLGLNLTNSDGQFALGPVTANQLVLQGYGYKQGTDGNPIQVIVTVFPDSLAWTFTN